MTDTVELRKLIKKKGLKLKYIAKMLGLSPYGLAKKINNEQEFKTGEIVALCELLDIKSLSLKERLFFKQKDDSKSTNT